MAFLTDATSAHVFGSMKHPLPSKTKMLPLSTTPDTASEGLRTLAPWSVIRLEMSPPPCRSVRTFVNSPRLSIFSPPGPTYRCPFTGPFDGFKSIFGQSSGSQLFSSTGVNCDFSVPTSLTICCDRFAVDGHVANSDCVQVHLVKPPLSIIGVVARSVFSFTGGFWWRQDLPVVVQTPPSCQWVIESKQSSPLFQTWFSFSSSDNLWSFSSRPRDQEMLQFLVHLVCHVEFVLKVCHSDWLLLVLCSLHRQLQRYVHHPDEVSRQIRPSSPAGAVLLSEPVGHQGPWLHPPDARPRIDHTAECSQFLMHRLVACRNSLYLFLQFLDHLLDRHGNAKVSRVKASAPLPSKMVIFLSQS